jgi:bifunctional UDP-N-acetylglucosamine pyrophosphorylase/glucosamine-1-phosphate N-acetyltransferase
MAYARCARALEDHPPAAAVIGVKEVDDPWRGAAVYEEDGRIRRIIEKPPIGASTTHWNSAGLFALRPVAFEYLERLEPSSRNEYELTSIFEMMLTANLDLRISVVDGRWRDVGYPEDLAAANDQLTPNP